MNPILEAAEAEVSRITGELLASPEGPKFQELLRAQEVVNMFGSKAYVAAPMQSVRKRAALSTETESARVVKAAADFLRQRKGRCTSSTITSALSQSGVEIGGTNKSSRVSAYLSAAKGTFDNVRGEGYGLKEWHNGAGH